MKTMCCILEYTTKKLTENSQKIELERRIHTTKSKLVHSWSKSFNSHTIFWDDITPSEYKTYIWCLLHKDVCDWSFNICGYIDLFATEPFSVTNSIRTPMYIAFNVLSHLLHQSLISAEFWFIFCSLVSRWDVSEMRNSNIKCSCWMMII